MHLYAFSLCYQAPEQLFAHLCQEPYSLFFDSSAKAHLLSCYSYIAYHPFETIEAKADKIYITSQGLSCIVTADPFEFLKERLKKWEKVIKGFDASLMPFQGGAAGFFSYDLARRLEKIPSLAKAQASSVDMAIGLYDKIVAFDHQKKLSYHLIIAKNEKQAQQTHKSFIERYRQKAPKSLLKPSVATWQRNFKKEDYLSSVQKAIDYIYEGDIFQVNLSQKFTAFIPPDFNHYAHYLNLRKVNPAPFSAYMNFGPLKLASASPEQFLSLHSQKVTTSPIKGTRRRGKDDCEDNRLYQELLCSEKDRAENVMIVDLMRNDLSKVCKDSSIQVSKLCAVESFATVHHLVSTITGALKKDFHPVDLLKACFPGGSITGAPKVRAMEIIEELEPERRGPYCGAMGYIGFNQSMETSIAIRTFVFTKDSISFNVGGGIVSDSTPRLEYQETLDKAKSLFKSLADEKSPLSPISML